jgi:excisionase family DNA binding protein
MQNDSLRTWFTAKEAADHIGVHLKTLYGYIRRKRNRPPFRRIGDLGRYRFPKDQFIEWADGPTKKG